MSSSNRFSTLVSGDLLHITTCLLYQLLFDMSKSIHLASYSIGVQWSHFCVLFVYLFVVWETTKSDGVLFSKVDMHGITILMEIME